MPVFIVLSNTLNERISFKQRIYENVVDIWSAPTALIEHLKDYYKAFHSAKLNRSSKTMATKEKLKSQIHHLRTLRFAKAHGRLFLSLFFLNGIRRILFVHDSQRF